jgi:peptidoglycan L-alanyl-D-glutamate endopeptidase CwlK
MANYKLSKKSLSHLDGVNEKLVKVVKRAIEISIVDFLVVDGGGASQTIWNSGVESYSVDLIARPTGNQQKFWIADAMKLAGIENQVVLKWGGAWDVQDLTNWMGTSEEAMNYYIDSKRARGKTPSIDASRFELVLDTTETTYYGA